MAEPRITSQRITPGSGLTMPLESWQEQVTRARERTANVRRDAAPSTPPRGVAADIAVAEELELAFEELSVASEELRVQNETLSLAHAALEADRERYRELFHYVPVPYLVTDVNGVIRDANRAARLMLRVPSDHLVGKPLAVFAQDVSRKRLRSVIRQLQFGGESLTTMLNVVPRGASVIRARLTATAARDAHGRLVELRWLIVDRTPQIDRARARRKHAVALETLVAERTAELERAQHLKDQLVANVSHEFRTALAAIGGYTELLAIGVRGALTETQLADVTRIHSAYEHLAKLVNDLLQYSKLTTHGMAIELDDFSLDDALGGIEDLIQPQAAQKAIDLRIVPAQESVVVHANVERVRQIMLNLLGNSVKFTPGGGRVVVQWRQDRGCAVVEVQDTGPGVPVEKREAIFEPFVRLKQDPSIGGTGLGLAISRDMARSMGGDLTVRDRSGGGSCFIVQLPLSTRIAPGM